MSRVDDRGWIPLHEAAVQEKKSILEIVFSGTGFETYLKGLSWSNLGSNIQVHVSSFPPGRRAVPDSERRDTSLPGCSVRPEGKRYVPASERMLSRPPER